MKYTKKWMVVTYVEEVENNSNYSNLEKIVKQDNITEDQKQICTIILLKK